MTSEKGIYVCNVGAEEGNRFGKYLLYCGKHEFIILYNKEQNNKMESLSGISSSDPIPGDESEFRSVLQEDVSGQESQSQGGGLQTGGLL